MLKSQIFLAGPARSSPVAFLEFWEWVLGGGEAVQLETIDLSLSFFMLGNVNSER